jgi:hypothetical protein
VLRACVCVCLCVCMGHEIMGCGCDGTIVQGSAGVHVGESRRRVQLQRDGRSGRQAGAGWWAVFLPSSFCPMTLAAHAHTV